jgi:DNA replication protein DnaC
VANGDTLVLLGSPRVRKPHMAFALGREAVRLRPSVQYVGAKELISSLAKAQAQHALEAKLTQYAKTRLLISDELGYLRLSRTRPISSSS